VHTESSRAFAALEFGPLGVVDSGKVVFRRDAPPRPAWTGDRAEPGLRVNHLDTRVGLLQTYTGMDAQVMDAHLSGETKGLALIAFGRGNVPPVLVPALRAAVARGVLVTVSSRCVSGRVSARYGYEGGGLGLAQAGALLVGDLPGAKARLLQMVALGGTPDSTAAATLIQNLTA